MDTPATSPILHDMRLTSAPDAITVLCVRRICERAGAWRRIGLVQDQFLRPPMPFRILVVEDDKSAAEFVTGGLRQEGYTVEAAANGPDALHMATRDRKSVV